MCIVAEFLLMLSTKKSWKDLKSYYFRSVVFSVFALMFKFSKISSSNPKC